MTTRRVQPRLTLFSCQYDHCDAISPRTAFTRRCRIKTEGGNLATPCLRGEMATARDHLRQLKELRRSPKILGLSPGVARIDRMPVREKSKINSPVYT